jgi:Na+-transporting NADH:ubiquinone oxidoreductase subunit NqrE
MNRSTLLKADAAINLILGILLMAFPAGLVRALGISMPDLPFYATILGGVLFGIGLALLIECYRKSNRFAGWAWVVPLRLIFVVVSYSQPGCFPTN